MEGLQQLEEEREVEGPEKGCRDGPGLMITLVGRVMVAWPWIE